MSAEDIFDNSSEAIETGTPQVESPSSTTTEAVLGNTSNQVTTPSISETNLGNSDFTTQPPTVTEVYGHALEESKKLEGLQGDLADMKAELQVIQEQQGGMMGEILANKNLFRDIKLQRQMKDLQNRSNSLFPQIASQSRSVETTEGGLEALHMEGMNPAKLEELKNANALNVPTSRFVDRVNAKSEEQLDAWKEDTARKEEERLERLEDPNHIQESRLEEINEMRRKRAEAAEERRIEVEARIMDAVVSRISSSLENYNNSFSSRSRDEGGEPFEVNPANLRVLAEQTYKDFAGIVSVEDFEIGVEGIHLQANSLKTEIGNGMKPNTYENQETLRLLERRRDDIVSFESEVKYKMIMLEVANEISENAGGSPVTAETFATELALVKEKMSDPYLQYRNWGDGKKVEGLYDYCREQGYRQGNQSNEAFIARTIDAYAPIPEGRKLLGSIPQYIADISNYYSIADLSSKDIPRIIAFYTEEVLEGYNKALDQGNFSGAISLSLALASEGKFLNGKWRDWEFSRILKSYNWKLGSLAGTRGWKIAESMRKGM